MKKGYAFLTTGSDTPWGRAFYEALASLTSGPVVGLQLADFRQVRKSKRHTTGETGLIERTVPVPPAYATRLYQFTRGYLTRTILREFEALVECTGESAFMILTNPAIERFTRAIPDDRLIYWNFDDYRLYQPERAAQITDWEAEAMDRARIVLCASRTQTLRLRAWRPAQAFKIRHFPNAVRREWISTSDDSPCDSGTVGYVGNMGARVDWQLVHDVALRCPERRFVFVGGLEQSCSEKVPPWVHARNAALALPNVEAIGPIPQAEVWRCYRSFEIGWMPYDIGDPFNIASCPTKIFDGLSAGRPFVATAVPECLLYPAHLPVITSAAEAPEVFAATLANWTPERREAQQSFARRNDWHARATWLLAELEAVSSGG